MNVNPTFFNSVPIADVLDFTLIACDTKCTPDEYKETVIDHPKEVMIKLDDNYKASLEKAFGSESQLRKDWLMRN